MWVGEKLISILFMSKIWKMILWIVIIVIVVGGGIWWWMASQNSAPAATTAVPAASNAVGATGTSGATATGAQSASYPQGSSDQAINQDMTSVDAQLGGLTSDNASVTQSMNDQPVQQAE